MARLNWTAEAERWLRDIYDYIAVENPIAAAEVVDGIYNQAQHLARFPEMGHRYAVIDQEVRILLYGHYRIAYAVRSHSEIDILGVFHGALDIDRYLLSSEIQPVDGAAAWQQITCANTTVSPMSDLSACADPSAFAVAPFCRTNSLPVRLLHNGRSYLLGPARRRHRPSKDRAGRNSVWCRTLRQQALSSLRDKLRFTGRQALQNCRS